MRLSRTGGVLGVVAAGSLLALGPQAGAAWDDLRTGTTSTVRCVCCQYSNWEADIQKGCPATSPSFTSCAPR